MVGDFHRLGSLGHRAGGLLRVRPERGSGAPWSIACRRLLDRSPALDRHRRGTHRHRRDRGRRTRDRDRLARRQSVDSRTRARASCGRRVLLVCSAASTPRWSAMHGLHYPGCRPVCLRVLPTGLDGSPAPASSGRDCSRGVHIEAESCTARCRVGGLAAKVSRSPSTSPARATGPAGLPPHRCNLVTGVLPSPPRRFPGHPGEPTNGLALDANEADFSIAALIRLAESAVPG